MAKKLVIISVDALGAADLAGDLSQLPTLQAFQQGGTHVQAVKGIYPTLTYPSHTTIMTGVYPRSHGIVNNTKLQSDRESPDWFWYDRDIQVPTLYQVAKEAGLKTAAFLWPVTAKSSIDYNIAEIFPNRIWTNQVLISLQASSPLFLFQMNRKFGHLRRGIQQPYLDDFITACATDTLITKQPDLTLIHLVDLDSHRHRFGVNSAEAQAALVRQDQRVKEIMRGTEIAGTYDDTVFVVLGDHFQIDVTKMIRLNHEFTLRGWQTPRSESTTEKGWDVYAKSCDGSTYIYCAEASLVEPREVREVITQVEGIEAIYSTEEAAAFGAASNCTFMVEASAGYFFTDEIGHETVVDVPIEEIGMPNRYRAVHGFSPAKPAYATTLMAMGPGIKGNHTISEGRLIDEAPTFAAILGLEKFPKNIDGQVITGLFD